MKDCTMISLDNLLLFVPMAAIFVMLPGPDFALIAKISLMNGRPQGQAAAVGVALGICVHTTAAMLGRADRRLMVTVTSWMTPRVWQSM